VIRHDAWALLSLSLAALAGCADDLRPVADAALVGDAAGDAATTGRVQTRVDGQQLVTTVDATRADVWVYVDLDQGERAAEAMAGWDVAFQRFNLQTNGGVSGTGGVEVARLTGTTLEAVTAAPAAGWLRDAAPRTDVMGMPGAPVLPDFAFSQEGGWYEYNMATHQVTPRDVVYLVRTTERRVVKLRLTAYYSAAGTGGYPSFRWAALGGTP